ncbi:MAG: hypothetical protein R3194_03045, partial [Limnobacter sp.]|nr:hypothetical protein [Limnobacter sp.]
MKQKKFRGIELREDQIKLVKHVDMVDDLTEQLRELQATWNNLGLLGELTNIGADIAQTRTHFQTLANDLSIQLIEQALNKVILELETKARNTIDVLVRNLFERTADIGFLSIDSELARRCADYEAGNEEWKRQVQSRMQDYVSKYSVYDNILILNRQGELLVDLTDTYEPGLNLRWLRDQIEASAQYLELFGQIDPLREGPASLLYGWKIQDTDGRHQGYVVLKFNLREESKALFDKILPNEAQPNWMIAGVIDPGNQVVFSSDEHVIKPGHTLRVSNHG